MDVKITNASAMGALFRVLNGPKSPAKTNISGVNQFDLSSRAFRDIMEVD